jgi:hypothetical protein
MSSNSVDDVVLKEGRANGTSKAWSRTSSTTLGQYGLRKQNSPCNRSLQRLVSILLSDSKLELCCCHNIKKECVHWIKLYCVVGLGGLNNCFQMVLVTQQAERFCSGRLCVCRADPDLQSGPWQIL